MTARSRCDPGGDAGFGRNRDPPQRRRGGRGQAGSGAAQDERALQARSLCKPGRKAGRPGSAPTQWRLAERGPRVCGSGAQFLGLVVAANARREEEEGETGAQEQVAHRRDVADDRDGDRDDVADRTGMQQEARIERGTQNDVERRGYVRERESGGRQRALPDRHVAAVDSDGCGV